jgi:hypothetical protein
MTMNQTEALSRLDEIERLDPDPTIDAGALEIIQELGATPEGLRLLVESYSGSPSANLVGYLALVLGEISNHSTPETAPLVFEFVARLRRNDYPEALISSLGAMQRQIGFGAGWGGTPRAPSSLFGFLQHCLNYTGRHNDLVQFGAVELIGIVCWGDLLSTAFEIDQLDWIQQRLDELSHTDDTLLSDSISEFRECLARKDSSLHNS